ncbi:MAG: GNAT family N-acetyltransferase [Rickettsiales bacterium]|jgi:RimJ/RimL family protein N-acetyltransferase|nr:GNAT family N-acetyltransferase [Rickettsiales bacterium]
MKVFYREFKLEDLGTWERLAQPEFRKEDFCDADYLSKHWDKINGWVLLDESGEWIGCCFLDFRDHSDIGNAGGVNFLEQCIFPKYRGRGYSKYIAKIRFDNSKGFQKSVCIDPKNAASIAVAKKYGFKRSHSERSWDIYICDAVHYPAELETLEIFSA